VESLPRLMNEPTIHEEQLGRLTWDPPRGCWTGEVELFPGQLVQLGIYQEVDLWAALTAARSTLDRIGENEYDLRQSAAAELIDDYNEEWNDGPLPLDEEEFSKRMRLTAITFFPNGEAELFYDDGGLFERQTILIAVGAGGTFLDVGFPR
jgi:hypothetical protein